MELLEKLDQNRKKYIKYNRMKIRKFQELLPGPNVKRIIDSIPFLLSINNPKLPGYVNGEVPMGITNYTVDEETVRFIRAKFKGTVPEQFYDAPFIEMLALMGSVGTIAYNKKSDFDYWVCVNRKQISDTLFARFREKVEGIYTWATKEIGAPVHLFINDITRIKQNLFDEDEDEAFGTTIGAVLKDEFLRSSIIVAGKVPFWWVVPTPVTDHEYDLLFGHVPVDRRYAEYVDLGNLNEISREDFLGAALFQIIKSLGNPFKSIIKIGVLEKYLFGGNESPILSQKVKTSILNDEINTITIDSYLLMFTEVYNYYRQSMADRELLDVLKQNLYLKIDPQLSKYTGIKDRSNLPYKVKVMLHYIKEWKWDSNTILDLDNFENWDFNKVMSFWDNVKKFMLLSYQRIASQLPHLNLKKKISDSDFVLLSRKIKTHFRKEKNKIEQHITFKDAPYEPILYIEPENQGVDAEGWRLFKRNRSTDDSFAQTVIRSEKRLLKLLAWTALNRIYDPVFTRLNIQSGYTRIDQQMATGIINTICHNFSGENLYSKNEYYLRPAFRLINLIILNFNIEEADEIKSIHYLYHTSWSESFLEEFSTENELCQILFEVLRDGLQLKRNFNSYCTIIVPGVYKKKFKQIISIFKEAYHFLIESSGTSHRRFITRIGNSYISIARDDDNVIVSTYPQFLTLLSDQALKPRKEISYTFHYDEAAFSSLQRLYTEAGNHTLTIAYEIVNNTLIVYVINETKNIFVFYKKAVNREQFLLFLYDFCKNISRRINGRTAIPVINEADLRILRISTDRLGAVSLTDETSSMENQYTMDFTGEGALLVHVAQHMSSEPFYDIIFPDKVSSGYMSIQEIYSVGDRIKNLKNSGSHVDNIVRDIEMSDQKEEDIAMGSIPYFLEKYRLEFMIEKAMR